MSRQSGTNDAARTAGRLFASASDVQRALPAVTPVTPLPAGQRSVRDDDPGESRERSFGRNRKQMAGLSHTDEADLTPRQKTILKLVVQEYVATGRPVGSKTLVEKYPLGISSATIRNEMADLEGAGYLQSPYTSGGRIPSDLGYRYYVHHLMDTPELPSGDQIMIRHQFQQVEAQLEQWVELAAVVLAETAGTVSVVTAPRPTVTRLRHVELISLQPRLALLILVTQESVVRQMMLRWPEDADQEVLSRIADDLVTELRGLTADEIALRQWQGPPTYQLVKERIVQALRALDAVEQVEVRHSGLENILAQPEFAGAEAQALLDILRGGGFLSAMLPHMESSSDVQVFIGDENPTDELRRFGVVLATYGVDGQVTGLLGVLGPTRMAYGRSISSVRYISRLISGLVAELHGM